MNILLIRPWSLTQTFNPPMGLLYLVGSLGQVANVKVDIVDARIDNLKEKALADKLARFSPHLVGITAMANERAGAIETAAICKRLWRTVPVIIGGAWSSTSTEDALQETGADIAVLREGEETFKEVVLSFLDGASLTEISGIALRNGRDILFTTSREYIKDLDKIPLPAYDGINLEKYLTNRMNGHNKLRRTNRVVPIYTSRGCPYGCSYCHGIQGKKFRMRSPEHVLEEVDLLVKKYKVEEIEIDDDIFNFDLKRAKKIIEMILNRGYKVDLSFPNGLRVDRMDEELIDMLKNAGCRRICYAIESASERIQTSIGKRINLDKAQRIISYTANKGISTGAYFMFGFPTETEDEMEKTISFAVESDLDTATFSYLAPFPGTKIFEEHPTPNWKKFRDYSEFTVNLSNASDDYFSNVRKKAYRRFYLSARRIKSNITKTPKNALLLHNAWAVFRLFLKDYVRY